MKNRNDSGQTWECESYLPVGALRHVSSIINSETNKEFWGERLLAQQITNANKSFAANFNKLYCSQSSPINVNGYLSGLTSEYVPVNQSNSNPFLGFLTNYNEFLHYLMSNFLVNSPSYIQNANFQIKPPENFSIYNLMNK